MVDFGGIIISGGIGLLTYIAFPWIFSNLYPVEWQNKVSGWYYDLAIKSYRKAHLIRRKIGTYTIKPFTWDEDKDAMKLPLGDGIHARDPDNRIHRLKKKPFGIVPEETPTVVDAELAMTGKHANRKIQEEGFTTEKQRTIQRDNQEVTLTDHEIDPYYTIPRKLEAVDPADALFWISGDVDPDEAETVKEYTAKSQEGYRSNINAADAIAVASGFLASFGSIVLYKNYLEKPGGGGGGRGAPSSGPFDFQLGTIMPNPEHLGYLMPDPEHLDVLVDGLLVVI